MSTINFWLWNWIFIPSNEQKNLITGLRDNNHHQSQTWFFMTVILNLGPFLVAVILERIIHPDNILCFLNNGSLPILSFGIIATNFFYLMQNMPDNTYEDIKIYENIKMKIYVIGSILMFLSGILYILQSNFISSFYPHFYIPSIIVSVIAFIYSISSGRKMFLLQNKFLSDFAEELKSTKNKLNNKDKEYED